MKAKLAWIAVMALSLSACGGNNAAQQSAQAKQVDFVSLVTDAVQNHAASTDDVSTGLIEDLAAPPGASLATQACTAAGGDCAGAMQYQPVNLATDKTDAFAGLTYPAVATPPGVSLATQTCAANSDCKPGLH